MKKVTSYVTRRRWCEPDLIIWPFDYYLTSEQRGNEGRDHERRGDECLEAAGPVLREEVLAQRRGLGVLPRAGVPVVGVVDRARRLLVVVVVVVVCLIGN